MDDSAGISFWALLRSIVLMALASQPIALAILGFAHTLAKGSGTDGLFAVFAAPMALAFFGAPVVLWSLILIVVTFYAMSWFGLRRLVPLVVFAEGAVIPLYSGFTDPAPSGALPGYEQAVLLFLSASLVTWAVYARFRLRFHYA